MVSILSSGSSGNSIYVETSNGAFLIDAGITGKKLKERLCMIGRSPENIKSIFVTHEHRDHVAGVGVLARKYQIPVYANANTWKAMKSIVGDISSNLCFEFPTGSKYGFGEVEIESYAVSHDACEPMFFVVRSKGKKIAILTDTGYVSEKMKETVKNADLLILECNHDIELLRVGGYPWHLQQRILSDFGHMSNEDAARVMCDIIGKNTQRIYMAHLSNDNNYQELARTTVEEILEKDGYKVGVDFLLNHTYHDRATSLVKV